MRAPSAAPPTPPITAPFPVSVFGALMQPEQIMSMRNAVMMILIGKDLLIVFFMALTPFVFLFDARSEEYEVHILKI
jgi:hypothetical protein